MSNPNFDPRYSSDQIWRGTDETRCLTDDLDTIESDIAALETDKADAGHTHTGYATADHVHTGYAASNHAHSEYAEEEHVHGQAYIIGLEDALASKASTIHTHSQYAETTHTHQQSDVSGLSTALGGKADLVDGKVPTSQLPSYVDDAVEYAAVSGFPTTGESGKIYVALDTNKTYRWSGTAYVEISESLALGETSSTAYRGDRGKTAYDHSQNSNVHITDAQKIAWNGKAEGDHSHSYNDLTDKPTADDVGAIAKALQMVSDTGSVEYEMAGLDVTATIDGMPTGMHTGYCPVNSTNAPLSNESWRFLIHKTGTNYGWVLAFGSYGSVYSNYVNGGTWRGWKNLVDGTSAPLWKHESDGGFYMTANQTVTPSKHLDQCRNGWLLMWSDYDPGTGVTNNADICTTTIPKRGPTGALWSGQGFLCSCPAFMNETEAINNTYVKKVYVHNDKLVGYAGNNVGNRRDVVLRAVYEY